MDKCGIYAIVNTKTFKVYVGSSKSISKRYARHLYELRHNIHTNPKIQSSYNIYGVDSFACVVIEECDESALLDLEQKYIDAYNCVDGGYNCNPFAEKPPSFIGKKHRDSTKRKMAESAKNRDKEWSKKVSLSLLGNKNSLGYRNFLGHKLQKKQEKKWYHLMLKVMPNK